MKSEEGTNDKQPVPEAAPEGLTDDEQPAPVLPDTLSSERQRKWGKPATSNQQPAGTATIAL